MSLTVTLKERRKLFSWKGINIYDVGCSSAFVVFLDCLMKAYLLICNFNGDLTSEYAHFNLHFHQ